MAVLDAQRISELRSVAMNLPQVTAGGVPRDSYGLQIMVGGLDPKKPDFREVGMGLASLVATTRGQTQVHVGQMAQDFLRDMQDSGRDLANVPEILKPYMPPSKPQNAAVTPAVVQNTAVPVAPVEPAKPAVTPEVHAEPGLSLDAALKEKILIKPGKPSGLSQEARNQMDGVILGKDRAEGRSLFDKEGKLTDVKAVRDFQERNKLRADGTIGPATTGAVLAAAKKPAVVASLTPPDSGRPDRGALRNEGAVVAPADGPKADANKPFVNGWRVRHEGNTDVAEWQRGPKGTPMTTITFSGPGNKSNVTVSGYSPRVDGSYHAGNITNTEAENVVASARMAIRADRQLGLGKPAGPGQAKPVAGKAMVHAPTLGGMGG